jgi:hypothetical protein
MAVYKIPQDVEADDKFVWLLSFKQFIFVMIAFVAGYMSFLTLKAGFWPAMFFLGPVIIITGFLGFPWGRDQPTEVWLAARIRFFLKPRVRIWNQSGINELVTVTAPKHIEKFFTDGLSQNEVKSRLSGLADLLDSRGWAVRNVGADAYTSNITLPSSSAGATDDRLFSIDNVQQVTEDTTATDILDETNSPTAQHFEDMIKASEDKHRQSLMDQLAESRAQAAAPQYNPPSFDAPQSNMPSSGAAPEPPVIPSIDDPYGIDEASLQAAAKAHSAARSGDEPAAKKSAPDPNVDENDFWTMMHAKGPKEPKQTNHHARPATDPASLEPTFATFQSAAIVAPHSASASSVTPVAQQESSIAAHLSSQDEQALLNKIHTAPHVNTYGHLKTLQPLGHEAPKPVTPSVKPAIMNLAQNNDLSVETIQRQTHKTEDKKAASADGEIVISLR